MQFSVFLSTSYSGYPYQTKHLFIEQQKNFEEYFILWDLDNAPAHNSQCSSEKIESAKDQRVLHPLYSPD
jgi:hypothetical protein